MKRSAADIREKKELEAARKAQSANDATRRGWGDINPVTKVIPNKKKAAQDKPKYREW